jgi:hypothetical protein
MRGKVNIWIFLGLFLFVTACNTDQKVQAPDVSGVQLDYEIARFEQLLMTLDTTKIIEELERIELQYPAFGEIFFMQVLPLKDVDSQETFYTGIRDFIRNKYVQSVVKKINDKYGDFSDISKELDQSFRYYQYYFPQWEAPNVYTFISDFGYQAFMFDDRGKDGVGIGLDLFLGPEFDYKALDPTNAAFSDYLTRSFTKEHITKRVMEQVLDDKMGAVKGNKFIDHMVHNGKKLYLLDLFMPAKHDSIIHEFSAKQLRWCEKNEINVWAYFLDKKMLYSSDPQLVNRYTRPAPTSRNLPADSPGRTGNFLGRKIVDAYIKNNPDDNIIDMLSLEDGTEFLKKSNYKPPK